MNDREFLIFLHNRFVHVYGEDELVDYLHRFRAIIATIPKNQTTTVSVASDITGLRQYLSERD